MAGAAATCAALAPATLLGAQVRLGPSVVTAERSEASAAAATVAVTRIDAAELRSTPHATVADLLRLAPGISTVSFDGLGGDPQIMVRGFYGGGEAEYVVVLVDGRPVNRVHAGTVAWDALPPASAIAAIEVVRGGASALYGDAAIGGVINVITRSPRDGLGARAAAQAGGAGSMRAEAGVALRSGEHPYAVDFVVDRATGFREHATRASVRAGGSWSLIEGAGRRLQLAVRTAIRNRDDPGPLVDSLRDADRRASDPLFRFDHTRDHAHAVTLSSSHLLGGASQVSGYLSADTRRGETVRTIPLAPGYGDTQLRELAEHRGTAAAQVDAVVPGGRLVAGTEVSYATLDSRYFAVVTGDRADHSAADGRRGPRASASDVARFTLGAYAQYATPTSNRLRWTLGGRLDVHGDVHDDARDASAAGTSGTTTAFSPKLGANVRLYRSDRAAIAAYGSVGGSFKAPTLDQRHDRREIPVPFPPFRVTTSNPALRPQYGTGADVGATYQWVESAERMLSLTATAYRMAMRDEIDFDVATLSYVNIGRSTHSGVELGARTVRGSASAFLNYALQVAEPSIGEHRGRQLKAIPRHQISAGTAVTVAGCVRASLVMAQSAGAYIDDANRVALEDVMTADLQLGARLRSAEVFLEARNLLDARFDATGFPDPGGSGTNYWYPAAGRVVSIGLRTLW